MKSKIHIWLAYPTVSIFALCLAVGIAFAQTRPSKLTGTVKTKLSRTAVIEQPTSAMIIKGRVLGSDNKPAFARVIALPNTSYGYEIRTNNKEGYFELPWSPTWLDKGQAIYIVAKSGHYTPVDGTRKDEAAIVEVTDPTQPVTIQLEPARLSLEGKVVDPKGQRIPKYRANLSLATEFKCQAPIFGTTVRSPWERIFSPIPYGTKYRLTIQAEGYQTKQVAVDAMDRTKEVIDIGTIILQPQDPAKSAVAEQKKNPDLAKEFHDIYRLDEGEIIKLIKLPFVLGRQEYLLTTPRYSSFALQHPGHHCGFHWDGELKAHSFSTSRSLGWILYYVLGIPEYDYKPSKGLNKVNLPGDWIVRTDSPKDEQLKALEEIIYAETNRAIRFEKRKVEREVVVAKGSYEFKPHPNGISPNHIHVTWDGTLGNWERTVNSLEEFFSRLEYYIKMKIVDSTEPMEKTTIRYKESTNLSRIGNPDVKKESLSGFLFNLSLTTSLRFTVENRPAEIWFVTETK